MKKILGLGAIVSAFVITGCFFPGPCLQGYGPVVTQVRELDGFSAVSNTGDFEVRVTRSDTFAVEVKAQENLMNIIETYVSGYTLIVKTKNGTCFNSAAPVVVYVSLPELEEIRNTGSGRLSADRSNMSRFECANTGSGRISIDSVFAATASLKNTGTGEVYVMASCVDEMHMTQTGSGLIDAGIVYGAADCSLNHTSSGKIFAALLDGTGVNASLTGSGRIELSGNAVIANYSLSSSGKIDALDLIVSDAIVSSTASGKIYVYATETLDVTITGSGDVIYRGNPLLSTRITGSGTVRPY